MEEENWKDIIGYEGLYQISNYGRVLSKKNNIFLKPKANSKYGHLKVCLCKRGNIKRIYVHRLVAIHFIDKLIGKENVNHIDSDPSNNYYLNLEWATSFENSMHAYKNNRLESCCLRDETPIDCYTIKGEFVKRFLSQGDAAREMCANRKLISACAKGDRNMHKGYIWKFANNELRTDN